MHYSLLYMNIHFKTNYIVILPPVLFAFQVEQMLLIMFHLLLLFLCAEAFYLVALLSDGQKRTAEAGDSRWLVQHPAAEEEEEGEEGPRPQETPATAWDCGEIYYFLSFSTGVKPKPWELTKTDTRKNAKDS